MAKKETPEEKEARLALEARELAAYRDTVPKRMMDAVALARSLGVHVNITLVYDSPCAEFTFYHDGWTSEDSITYTSEEWKLMALEVELRAMKEAQDAKEARRKLAQEIFDKLSNEEKSAIKEHIQQLKV